MFYILWDEESVQKLSPWKSALYFIQRNRKTLINVLSKNFCKICQKHNIVVHVYDY